MKTKLFFFALMAGLCLMAGCSKENKNNVTPQEEYDGNEMKAVFDLAMSSVGKRGADVKSMLASAGYEFYGEDMDEGLQYVRQDGTVSINLTLWYGSDGVVFSSVASLSSESSSSYIGDDNKFMQFVYSIGENPSLPSGSKARFAGFWFGSDEGYEYSGESWSDLKSCFEQMCSIYNEAEMSWSSNKDDEDSPQQIWMERESELDEEEIEFQIVDFTYYKE